MKHSEVDSALEMDGQEPQPDAGALEPVEVSEPVEAEPASGDSLAADAQQQLIDPPNHEELKAVVEAVIYITDEPLSADQIATALKQPAVVVGRILEELSLSYSGPDRGLTIREVAGGYKMSTKPEHHEAVRAFVKNLKPPLKLSLPALETLALIAYKQPITAPEIMEVRGVQGPGVLKTLLDRKLIATSGRKQVVGKPILYRTTKEFLIQFGLKDVNELPSLKEFEELGRLALTESDAPVESAVETATHAPDDTAQSPSDPENPTAESPAHADPAETEE